MNDDTDSGGNGDPEGDVSRYEWDENQSPSTGVAEAIAADTGRDVAAMAPLYEFVDTDALDALVTARNGRGDDVRVTFSYRDLQVIVSGDGSIFLRRR